MIHTKKIFSGALISVLMLFLSTPAFADPTNENKADNNPQVVAYYTSGTHGIVGENETHTGTDLVMQSGRSGNLQQWFLGIGEDRVHEGDHSVWRNVGNQTSCPEEWDLVLDAYPEWGDYLEPGANYCVHTNDYQVQK